MNKQKMKLFTFALTTGLTLSMLLLVLVSIFILPAIDGTFTSTILTNSVNEAYPEMILLTFTILFNVLFFIDYVKSSPIGQ